jgi:hypothetical protein
MTLPDSGQMRVLPMATDSLIGASCTLSAADLRERVAEWRRLRDRSRAVERMADGTTRLRFAEDEAMDAVARLVALESECCAFYRFTIRIEGPDRELTIDAGPGRAAAVDGLLGVGD